MHSSTYKATDNLDALSEAANYNGFIVSRITKFAGDCRLVADFGAGTGTLSRLIKDHGLEVVCIEQDQALKERLENDGFDAYLSLSEVSERRFDFIFSSNVLEHIDDHLSTLREIHGHLSEGGLLYLYVPAFNILFTSMDRKVGHLRRYTKSSLIRLLKEAGFEIEQAAYADSLGFFVTLAYRFLGDKSGTLNSKAVKMYDNVLFPISRMLDLVFHWLLGKNLEVVARRPRAS